jgi:Cof subfamily protein (haloacid dehalogenase superfamily)
MGKFDGILICTDLDGTLYKNDKTISLKNRNAIEYFKREGGYFTFITGRLPYYSKDAYNSVRPNVPFGCINGGGIYDGATDKYVWTREISRDVIELISAVDEQFSEIGIQVCCFDKTYFAEENEMTQKFRKRTGLPNLICNYRDVKEPIGKIIFSSEDSDELSAIEKVLISHPLADGFDFIRSERTLLEILPKGVTKGLALIKLSEYLNVDINSTIAIGDFDNDVAMLKTAKLGIAVSNASRAALDVADYVTVSNEENAIAAVIHDLENGRASLK